MRHLSKSKLISFRQCPKRLWLEIHKPELRDDSSSEQAFAIGNQVGEIAMEIYNLTGDGYEISIDELGFAEAFNKSSELLEAGDRPVFEAGVKVAGGLAFADVMLPTHQDGELSWKMVEVKSSTSLKDYHRDDAAIQHYLFQQAGVKLHTISLAHIDNTFVYPGGGDYQGLLHENDLTQDVRLRTEEVKEWLDDAQATAALTEAPEVACGGQCSDPFDCPFTVHCTRNDSQPTYPLSLLPRIQKKKVGKLHDAGIYELSEVPDSEINATQQRVKSCTLSNTTYFNLEATTNELAQYGYPAYFLDFETSMSAIPVWKGTRPYQQLPFQFSVHVLHENGSLEQETFLDLSGDDPRLGFTEALIKHCGSSGPIFVYNVGFERRIIREQIDCFPQYKTELTAIIDRLVDLLPIARSHYYHPSQLGSWSIKKVLPAICPDLDYGALDGVQDGGMAMVSFQEAIHPNCSPERKDEIYQELDKYCQLDTLAMVRIWEVFTGRIQHNL